MNVRFVSSLTPEDEARLAPMVLNVIGAILDQLPIAYTIRIETPGDRVFQHSHAGAPLADGSGEGPLSAVNGAPISRAFRG